MVRYNKFEPALVFTQQRFRSLRAFGYINSVINLCWKSILVVRRKA